MAESDATPETLPVAMLLAATGGMLDAFVYLNHGRVFANAMTGNVALLGVSAVTRHWDQAVRHLVPLTAFLCGVTASRGLQSWLGRRSGLAALALEIVALAGASLLPESFPEMGFTAAIALVASCQITSFRRVGNLQYNSTFMTGNLRTMIEGVYESFSPEKLEMGLWKAKTMGGISVCFLLGVGLGAWLAPRFGNHTLWFVLPLLGVVAILEAPAALKEQVAPELARG